MLVGVPSFITTLGMIFLLNGITLNISHGFPVETPGGLESDFFRFFGGSPYSAFYWAIGVVIVMTILLTSTRWGLHTVATGGNAVGASESGVNVRAVKVGNFVMCSMLGALAGILEAVRITSIQPLQGGTSVMFYAVAAAVIGGTSLFGGSGTVIGAALGVLVLAILNLGFTLQGISAFTFDLVLGVAIIASHGAERDARARPPVAAASDGSRDGRARSRRARSDACGGRRDPRRERPQELRRRHRARGRLPPPRTGRGARPDRRQRRRQVDARQDPDRLPQARRRDASSSSATRCS